MRTPSEGVDFEGVGRLHMFWPNSDADEAGPEPARPVHANQPRSGISVIPMPTPIPRPITTCFDIPDPEGGTDAADREIGESGSFDF